MSRTERNLFSYFKPVQAIDKTPSNKHNPLPVSRLIDTSKQSNSQEQENEEPMQTTPRVVRKRSQPLIDDDDSEGEIGRFKNLSGRPKRKASMTVNERAKTKKRKKRVFDSDDDEEYQPKMTEEQSEEDGEDKALLDEEELDITPAKKKSKQSSLPKTPKTPRTPAGTGSATPTFSSPSVLSEGIRRLDRIGNFLHDTLDFLKDENRRDKNGNKINDPDFNPRTLHVPSTFIKKVTPAMRQWWDIKSDNYDTVLFFKVGKFYELYHMDAVIGVKELNLLFMKGQFAHAGFPEHSFGRYSQTLVQKGYKVARVEQTETPQMMEQRLHKMSTSPVRVDKVVRRELCALISKGTRTIGFFQGEEPTTESAYLLAIKEKPGSCSQSEHEFGVCFIDTCIGTFHLGQFKDDRHCSRLRTLLAHYPPSQVLLERGNVSHKCQHLINQVISISIRDILIPGSEFWDGKKTLNVLQEDEYFEGNKDEKQLPDVLQKMISQGTVCNAYIARSIPIPEDGLGLSPNETYELALSALGACIWTLKRSLIDTDILRQFEEFIPVDEMNTSHDCSSMSQLNVSITSDFTNRKMVLDDITLANLDVIDNSGRMAGTLMERLYHCCTAFGRRLLKQWLSAPLCNPSAINDRLDAVTDLVHNSSLMFEVKGVLQTIPDLERMLRRVYSLGSKVRSETHPDNRAIFYEEILYNKKKINDFLNMLEGFKNSTRIIDVFSPYLTRLSSHLLKQIVTPTADKGLFPDLKDKLHFFDTSFDHQKARSDGAIIPRNGVNNDYDTALQNIEQIDQNLDDYIKQQKKRLHCKNISYWGTGRNRFQLEVPESLEVPDSYELKSQKKGFRRYWTREIEEMLSELVAAEEKRDSALRDTMRTIFYSFGEDFSLWDSAVRCLSILDVLVAMATFSAGNTCRPIIVTGEEPFLEIYGGRHPCVVQTFTGDEFVPNDVIIDSEGSGKSCLVVTGPNMGGKSTLLRQTGLIVILAQMGCFVPAESCKLTPVDRIFTRLGASDRIMKGESTFYVEVSETSVILQHSTINSLVLLDELGRGTATYDGTAIASAVIRSIVDRKCRTLFSTHYHTLVDELKDNPRIQLGHMACMVESEEENEGEESITFLYKFIDGACPKSYGFNAANLAGVPLEVIHVARKKAFEFEITSRKQQLFRKLMCNSLTTPTMENYHAELEELYSM